MRHVFVGRTGLRVSELAFGTMSFGGDADEETSSALYARCRDAGVNLFDCADVYSHGRAEEILGRLVRDHRDQVVVATKAYFPMGGDPNARGASRYHLVRAVEASLRRLATDRIDLFYLHRWDDDTHLEETLRAVDDLVRAGKVLYPAVSNYSAWQAQKALGVAARRGLSPLVAMQPMYNLLKRQAEVEILPMAASERIGVFPYSPLAGGLLTGKYGVDRRPDSGRLQENEMYKTRYSDPSVYEVADRFSAIAQEAGVAPATLAVAWVAAHPAVTAPLLGARRVDQLDPCLAAACFEMTPELYRRIAELTPTPPPATDRSEEQTSFNYDAALKK